MSQPFTFPPPPPPPPKSTANHNSFQPHSGRGGQRGRGNFSNFEQNSRGRGTRGQYPSRGSQRGGYNNRENGVIQSSAGHSSYGRNVQNTTQHTYSQDGSQNAHSSTAQKRLHSTAFSGQPANHVAKHRPSAPPAVPSFGIDFNALLPRKPEPTSVNGQPTTKKINLLGLTPAAQTADSESEDDNEEETKLADAYANNDVLEFEYRGQTSALKSPEEIARWIAERRKKWPTEAKREVARKEAEERKKKLDAERLLRLEASKAAAKVRQEERQKQRQEKEKSIIRQKLLREQIQKANIKPKSGSPDETQTPAQIKAERLRRKAQKVAQQLKVAEEALSKQEAGQDESKDIDDINALASKADQTTAAEHDLVGSLAVDPDLDLSDVSTKDDSDSDPESDPKIAADDTSTSGSSSSDTDSDSDSPPEQSSSKQTPTSSTKPPSTSAPSPPDTRPLCTNFTKTGRCKFGRRCHFRHEKPDKKAHVAKGSGTVGGANGHGRRKGLYQIMVEKEQEQEKRRALNVIIALGRAGVLDGIGDDEDKSGV